MELAHASAARRVRGDPRLSTFRHVLLTVVAALLVTVFLVTTVGVRGDSMRPGLLAGERALSPVYETWLARLGMLEWQPGDIVYFRDPLAARQGMCPFFCTLAVKRVVAVGDDTVEIRQGILYVNGQEQAEEYLGNAWRGSHTVPLQLIPEGSLYVLGDNRGPYGSQDSRSYGPVPAASVAGRTAAVIWPLFRRTEAGWMFNPRVL